MIIKGYLRSKIGVWGPAVLLQDGKANRVYISKHPNGRFFFNTYVNGVSTGAAYTEKYYSDGKIVSFKLEHDPSTGKARARIGGFSLEEKDAPTIELIPHLPERPNYYKTWLQVPEYRNPVLLIIGAIGLGIVKKRY